MKTLGADEVICSATEDIVARVKEITAGKGAWGGLDAVCGDMTATVAASMRPGGTLFLYGVLAGYDATINAVDLLFRGVELIGWVLYTKVMNQPEKCQAIAPEVAPLVRVGIIPVPAVEKFDLADFKQAMARAEAPGVTGKIFLVNE